MRIDFYGDLICPWCHLGWRRLQAAILQRHSTTAMTLRWRPYQLNPDLPVNGIERGDYLLRKFGNAERVREVLHAIETAMRADGIHVNLHRIKVASNTYLAHRLMLLAEQAGAADTLMNEFFVAYFVMGKDVGDPHVLRELAHAAKLPAAAVETELTSHEPHPDIAQSELEARQIGIRAVPYVLFDGRYSIAGAHDPIAFLPLVDLCALMEKPEPVSEPDAAG
jgi:predicted DsbA family dithiol-disulfide isomerase